MSERSTQSIYFVSFSSCTEERIFSKIHIFLLMEEVNFHRRYIYMYKGINNLNVTAKIVFSAEKVNTLCFYMRIVIINDLP